MVLEQKDFGWIRGSLEYLSVKPRTDGQLRPGIADHLLAGNDTPVDLQQPVGTKCNHCGTEGRTKARPRWTKDIRPAFYAQAREGRSETCKNKKRIFVPPTSQGKFSGQNKVAGASTTQKSLDLYSLRLRQS